MIELLKASAGSGKTHTLAHSYIKLLMDNPDDFAYRHILAVTFTNKATDEMKGRILKELSIIAKDADDPRSAKARRVLSNILHDYSAFNISTIDRFFQQTLRSFAHEMGQYNNYQVELDKEMLSDEAVDTILDELDADDPSDRELIGFIVESMEERASEQKSTNIESSLKEMARQLKSEHFSLLCAQTGMKPEVAYSTEGLRELKKRCRGVIRTFEDDLKLRAKDITDASTAAGLESSDYYRGWFSWFDKFQLIDRGEKVRDLTAAFRDRASNPDQWFSAAKASRLAAAQSAVGGKVAAFLKWWDSAFRIYNTAGMMLGNVYGLGVAARLFTIFTRIQKERGVICLDDSNTLLRKIIDGSDTPFVYEKTGVWINHYLLDEFQDTSITQWDNFSPLLRESESHDYDNLIVGDVKQSIYRWRESDWNLLDSRVEAEFPGHTKCRELRSNYRSFQQIVDFNNDFYTAVSAKLDALLPSGPHRSISGIYSDVRQSVGKKEHGGRGYVEVAFHDDADAQLDALVSTVNRLHREHHVPYGDIAVLVRKNEAGTLVAQKLIDADIPVITEASLCIKNSISVRRLVSLMAYVDNPSDKVNCRVAEELSLAEAFAQFDSSFHDLVGLCDKLYRFLLGSERSRTDCEREVAYIVAFVDYLMDYTRKEGNNLRDFLNHWEDDNPTISSTLDAESVKIITIHKSKGLDFPYVILPLLEGVELYFRFTKKWCIPQVDGTALDKDRNRLFHVPLSSGALATAFASSYLDEQYNQCVDAVNMMYVATTRASRAMFMMGTPSESGCANFADILRDYCEGQDRSWGEIPPPAAQSGGERAVLQPYTLSYPVWELGGRLMIRPYAQEYFTCEGGQMSYRQRGVVMHDILSRVVYADDLERSVDQSVADGSLPLSERDGALKLLGVRIAAHPDFFPQVESGCRVLNETTVIAADGTAHRPDRVIMCPDSRVIVVDYKFGVPKEEYTVQIEGYKELFKEMGHSSVEAHLWFVYKDKIM